MNQIFAYPSGTRIGNHPLRHGEFVPTAARLATLITEKALQDPESLIPHYQRRNRLTQTIGRMTLPIEEKSRDEMIGQLHIANLEIARYEHTPEFGLPTITPRFLAWKNSNGLPAFSVFRLDNKRTEITFNYDGVSRPKDLTMRPNLPEIMARHYLNPVLALNLKARCETQRLSRITLAAEYGGMMPDEVRDKIDHWIDRPAGEPCFEDIFIVAEAPADSWKITSIPKKDPLVIGVAHGLLWLIAAYDLTPTEQFAHDLFVSTPRPNNQN